MLSILRGMWLGDLSDAHRWKGFDFSVVVWVGHVDRGGCGGEVGRGIAFCCRTMKVMQKGAVPTVHNGSVPRVSSRLSQPAVFLPCGNQRKASFTSQIKAENVNAAAVETETDLSAELAKYLKNIKPKVRHSPKNLSSEGPADLVDPVDCIGT